MELIAAVLLAGPLGYFARRGLLFYLAVWALILPVQTVVVFDAGDGGFSYWVVNAVILAFGTALNRAGHRLRVRHGKDQGGLVMRSGVAAKTIEP